VGGVRFSGTALGTDNAGHQTAAGDGVPGRGRGCRGLPSRNAALGGRCMDDDVQTYHHCQPSPTGGEDLRGGLCLSPACIHIVPGPLPHPTCSPVWRLLCCCLPGLVGTPCVPVSLLVSRLLFLFPMSWLSRGPAASSRACPSSLSLLLGRLQGPIGLGSVCLRCLTTCPYPHCPTLPA